MNKEHRKENFDHPVMHCQSSRPLPLNHYNFFRSVPSLPSCNITRQNNLAVHITFSNQSSRRKVICYPSGIPFAIPRTTTRLNEPCQLRIQISNGFVHFSTNQRGNNNQVLLLPENQILQTPNFNNYPCTDINESAPVCSIPSAHKF